MIDPRLEKLADILVNYCAAVRPGDWVRVQADVLALPLVHEVQRLILQAGGHPNVQLSADELEESFLREASEEQLTWIAPIEPVINEQIAASLRIAATSNTRAFTAIDPSKPRLFQKARRGLRRAYTQRAAAGKLRWVLTQYPCPAYAQEADMRLREYENFVYAATFADQPDPVACWRGVHDSQQRLVDWLKGKRQVVVRGPNIDMTLSIEGRTFVNSDGKR